ncbi:MAG: DUF2267 domain-containing protein [Candidatus Dormibacteraeota bacterium]|nr:DUF2267 domain-containing protein [Candidatus Dormibacteraeota bacterium]
MDTLISEVSSRTGLPADQARQAVEAVVGVLKDRLPEPMKGMVDQFLVGGGQGGGDAMGEIEGLFKG